MDKPQTTELPAHVQPESPESVCWLLDVRRYGIEIANQLHP